MAVTTITQVPAGISAFYDRNTLERALPACVHDMFGQMRPLPSKNSTSIKFRRYNALSVNTTALTEGVTPSGKQLSVTDITDTIAQYGDYVTVSDVLDLTNLDNTIKEATDVLGEQAGQSLDQVWRDKLVAGTNVYYAGAVASRVLTNTAVTTTDLDNVILALKNQNAKYYTEMIKGSTSISTTPIRPAYFAIIHPSMTAKVEALTGFKSVETYASQNGVYPTEVGAYKNLRFIETTNAKVFTGAGAGGKDVYAMLVFGKDAYGVIPMRGSKNIETIVKPIGSSGSSDPLNQVGSVGWKAWTTCKILNDAFMIRYESTLS